MSKVLRILAIRPLGFTATLAQTPRKIGRGEGTVEVDIGCRFRYVRRDVEIWRIVRGKRVLRWCSDLLQLLLERRRWACGRFYQCGYQCPVWHALVELFGYVTPCPTDIDIKLALSPCGDVPLILMESELGTDFGGREW